MLLCQLLGCAMLSILQPWKLVALACLCDQIALMAAVSCCPCGVQYGGPAFTIVKYTDFTLWLSSSSSSPPRCAESPDTSSTPSALTTLGLAAGALPYNGSNANASHECTAALAEPSDVKVALLRTAPLKGCSQEGALVSGQHSQWTA